MNLSFEQVQNLLSRDGRSNSNTTTEKHSTAVAPSGIDRERTAIHTGEQWCRTLAVVSWPKHLPPGILDKLHTHPSSNVDVTIHANPIGRDTSINSFEDAIRDLKGAKIEKQNRNSATLEETERRLREHVSVRQQLSEGEQRVYDVAVYITLRAESRERLDKLTRHINAELTGSQITLKPVTYRQEGAMVAASPIALDPIEETTKMVSGAVASLYPFSTSTVIEESGILVGYHATTDAPVIIDRFTRENGYNCIVSGKTGDGKSFGAKLMLLRRLAKDPDTIAFIIDPLSDYRRLVDKLDGEHIVIGGRRGLNPLDIQPTPEAVLDQKPDLNPFGKKKSSVMGFFSDYFESQGMEMGFKRTVLDIAVTEAYDRAGIDDRIETHHHESPTPRDVRSILREISESPEDLIDDLTDRGVDAYEDAATKLRMALHPFAEGQSYAHLGGESDISVTDSKLVYLDLQQSESERELGLMMQLLLDAIYQRAKTTTKDVILCIDEAHYLLENEHSLGWLDRVTRHARHHSMSLQLSTQKIEDFLQDEKRRTILGNCSMQLHWRENKLSESHREALDLTEREGEFVRNALPGSMERGYSQALCVVDGKGAYPVKVSALTPEAALIDESVARNLGVE
ncbi:VirB4 family type IV secretion system protein [Halomarina litorea]|uniref:VirB4 family type IV secretion system protein n=1 Tax=Halomarina litorea TaxID=2961595 RepID=UPI0020C1C362|nr:ATP-binding protein [Halomarina sp. BCD28]